MLYWLCFFAFSMFNEYFRYIATDQELNFLYRKKLREGPSEKSGGAGLGLIDIARDSNSHFYFNFKKVDNYKSFYSICVKV